MNDFKKNDIVIINTGIGKIIDVFDDIVLVELDSDCGKITKWLFKSDVVKYNKKPNIELGVLPNIYQKVKSFLKIKE